MKAESAIHQLKTFEIAMPEIMNSLIIDVLNVGFILVFSTVVSQFEFNCLASHSEINTAPNLMEHNTVLCKEKCPGDFRCSSQGLKSRGHDGK